MRADLRSWVVIAILATTSGVAGQDAHVEIGASGSLLGIGLDSMSIHAIRGTDTLRTGTLWDELLVEGEGEDAVLRRVYRSRDLVLGERLDTLINRHRDLLPVRQHSVSSRITEELNFADGVVRGRLVRPGGETVTVEVALTEPAYNAANLDLVLRAAPLDDGWTADVPVFLPSAGTVVRMRSRVTAAEVVFGEPCWKVESDFAGTPVTFWIAQESRRLVQQVMRLGPPSAPVSTGGPRAPAAST